MQDNLKRLLERLLQHEIDFVLAGGLASVLHGSPLVTQDIDICISIDETQVGKLRNALKDLAPRHRMNPNFKPSFLTYPEKLEGVNNIYLETDWGVLDILSELKPVGRFARIKQNATAVSLFGHECRVVCLEDLIKIKETMTRPKDKETLTHLREILRKNKGTYK
ncbi:MAG: nucleotidyltransferase [Deltaproteobacteria bacterium]|nr:nucleotidyltransferase [Deltaproteobacteria bacterium]MBI3295983.1 nucleotidyltransferase [Deltaproteobacteria bacterium]